MPHQTPTVEQLVEQARRGDARAFSLLVERHERLALSTAYAQVQDSDLAGDIVQDAMIKAWQKLSTLTQPDRFGSWLCGIVRNLGIDHRRRNRLVPASIEHAADHPVRSDPAQQLQSAERTSRISDALAELDEVTRTAMALRYYDNLSSQQIAQVLDISPAAVDMRLSRGRAALRQSLATEVIE